MAVEVLCGAPAQLALASQAACEVRRWGAHKDVFKCAPGRSSHECTLPYDHIIFNIQR